MTIDAELLSECYAILKQYIPQRDRQEAADNLMSVLVDVLDDSELTVIKDTDVFLTRAHKEYVGDADVEEDQDDE